MHGSWGRNIRALLFWLCCLGFSAEITRVCALRRRYLAFGAIRVPRGLQSGNPAGRSCWRCWCGIRYGPSSCAKGSLIPLSSSNRRNNMVRFFGKTDRALWPVLTMMRGSPGADGYSMGVTLAESIARTAVLQIASSLHPSSMRVPTRSMIC